MVRAPCCEKMGLKKGSWTSEEDRKLVAYIQRYGHGNWRALPKQAGLLRCGKSCRLRWINYLKPDIKRGNFTKDEEEAIIKLHEMLGNRWSAIAARLPGRTDNEIKNVWHTHLKKRAHPTKTTVQDHKKTRAESKPIAIQPKPSTYHKGCDDTGTIPVSPALSCCETSSSGAAEESNGLGIREEYMDSWQEHPEIDESFWSEELSMDVSSTLVDDFTAMGAPSNASFNDPFQSFSQINTDDMNFWLRVFIEAQDLQQLPDYI